MYCRLPQTRKRTAARAGRSDRCVAEAGFDATGSITDTARPLERACRASEPNASSCPKAQARCGARTARSARLQRREDALVRLAGLSPGLCTRRSGACVASTSSSASEISARAKRSPAREPTAVCARAHSGLRASPQRQVPVPYSLLPFTANPAVDARASATVIVQRRRAGAPRPAA